MKTLGEKIEFMTSELLDIIGMPVRNVEKIVDVIINKIHEKNRKQDDFHYFIPVKGMKKGEIFESSYPWSGSKEMVLFLDIPRLSWIFSISNVDVFKEEMENYLLANFLGQYELFMPYLNMADEIYLNDVEESTRIPRKKMMCMEKPTIENYISIRVYTSRSDWEVLRRLYPRHPKIYENIYFKHPSVIIRTAAFLVRAAKDGVVKICDKCVFPTETTRAVTGCTSDGLVEPPSSPYPVIFARQLARALEPRVLFLGDEGRLGLCGGKSIDSLERSVEISSAFTYILRMKARENLNGFGNDFRKYIMTMKNVGWRELRTALYTLVKNKED